MRKLILIVALLISAASVRAQGSIVQDVVLRPGTGVGGARVAVCQPIATSAASVTSNLVVLTVSSTAGFVTGMTIMVSGFTGADTFFNGGTVANSTLTGGYTILALGPTTIVYALTHANASASSNGTVLQMGNAANGCAPLSTIFFDPALTLAKANPFVAEGTGNYSFAAIAGQYFIQLFGPGITTSLRELTVPSATGSAGTVTSFSAGNLSPLFTTSVATSTTTPALSFALSNAAADTVFGNCTGVSAAPSYCSIVSAMVPNPLIMTAVATNSTPIRLNAFSSAQAAPLLDLNTGIGTGTCPFIVTVCFHGGSPVAYIGALVADTGDNVFQLKNNNSATLFNLKIANGGALQLQGVGATTVQFQLFPGNTQVIDPTANAKFELGPAGGSWETNIATGIVDIYAAQPTVGNGQPAIRYATDQTVEVTGNVGPVTVFTPTVTGLYRISIYTVASTGVGGSTVQWTIGYTDVTGANTTVGSSISTATTGLHAGETFVIEAVSGVAITITSSTASSPRYKYYPRVEAL